jgi:hypothetical protein
LPLVLLLRSRPACCYEQDVARIPRKVVLLCSQGLENPVFCSCGDQFKLRGRPVMQSEEVTMSERQLLEAGAVDRPVKATTLG